MYFIDTHTHLYLNQFDEDRTKVIEKSISRNIKKMVLPNIDSKSIEQVKNLCYQFPDNCFPLMGLHPTSVKENYESELNHIFNELNTNKYYGIGEIGIDLYWDRTFIEQQKDAFARQIEYAKQNHLPIVIHARDSFNEIFDVMDQHNDDDLFGIFHCFTGNTEQAHKALLYGGFKLGIGGVLTYKNSGLDKTIAAIDLEHLVLETDSPFLTPVPHRGKRNESAYILLIAQKLAEIKNCSLNKIADITTQNALELFKLNHNE